MVLWGERGTIASEFTFGHSLYAKQLSWTEASGVDNKSNCKQNKIKMQGVMVNQRVCFSRKIFHDLQFTGVVYLNWARQTSLPLSKYAMILAYKKTGLS